MELRTRAAVGAVAVATLFGCTKGAESVIQSASSMAQEIKATRILEKAPGTWVCRSRSPRPAPSGPGTSLETGEDRLTVTIEADGRFGYVKYGWKDDQVEYEGYGEWTLVDGELEIRTHYDRINDEGYRIRNVSDTATEVLVEEIEFRTNGSRVPEDDAGPMGVEIIDDDTIEFDVGRGYLWRCGRDADETPVDVPGSMPAKPKKVVGELLGKVTAPPSDDVSARFPRIVLKEKVGAGEMEDLGTFPTIGDDGTFDLELPPGDYTMSKDEPFIDDGDERTCAPVELTVVDGETTRAEITCE